MWSPSHGEDPQDLNLGWHLVNQANQMDLSPTLHNYQHAPHNSKV